MATAVPEDGRFVMHSLGALVVVHDRRYAQNHLLDVVTAAHLLCDPEGRSPLPDIRARIAARLGLDPAALTTSHLERARRLLEEMGLFSPPRDSR